MALIVTDSLGNSYTLSVDDPTNRDLILTPSHSTPSPSGANSITVQALDIITAAMKEIGALAAGESVPTEQLPDMLQKLQRVIDYFNARGAMIYNVNFSRFTLPINTLPVTIGPGANFDVSMRPVKIPSISLILTTGTPNGEVEIPLNPRDQDWWAQQTIKNLASTLPTDFYYSPDWPNGGIYFWPVPTAVNDVRVEMPLVLGEYTAYNQNFTLPPGYWDAVVYSLALSICPMFKQIITPDLRSLWLAAIKAIQSNNISSPRLASDSPSQSAVARSRPDFSFLTGLPQ